jgi:hypothetical protein
LLCSCPRSPLGSHRRSPSIDVSGLLHTASRQCNGLSAQAQTLG